jgi:hypothetical protein
MNANCDGCFWYRRGYYDGYDGKTKETMFQDVTPFAAFDYDEGYKAGTNDKHCSKLLSDIPQCISGKRCDEVANCFCDNCRAYAEKRPTEAIHASNDHSTGQSDSNIRHIDKFCPQCGMDFITHSDYGCNFRFLNGTWMPIETRIRFNSLAEES